MQDEAKKTANSAANEDKGLDVDKPKDEDPDGAKLLQASDPLERAAKYLKPLATMAKDSVETWIAIYDVAVRRSRRSHCLLSLSC